MRQSTGTVIMIEPTFFEANPKTLIDNPFAHARFGNLNRQQILERVAGEFNLLRSVLMDHGVRILSFPGISDCPDGVFPNNWLVTLESGKVILCPMMAGNRQMERRAWPMICEALRRDGFMIDKSTVVDMSYLEKNGQLFEGTGSLVLDRINKVAYAALSQRTTMGGVKAFADTFSYQTLIFQALDEYEQPIYHTNVMMAIGLDWALLCPDALPNETEREMVYASLRGEGLGFSREVIEITWEQVKNFCGNILELTNSDGEKSVAMSETAKRAFRQDQIDKLEKWGGKIISADITVIEVIGGGGVRCMLAEIFLPKVPSNLPVI